MIFETHAHYDDKMFDEDRESLLESMQEAGIGRIVNIGADLASTASSIALAEKYPFIYAAAGVHPSDAAQLNEHTFQWLSEQTAHEKVVAVGRSAGLLLGKRPGGQSQSAILVQASAESCQGKGIAGFYPFKGCGEGYIGYCEGRTSGRNRRRSTLFFLYSGNGQRISEYGHVSGHRRCSDIQECQSAEGSG